MIEALLPDLLMIVFTGQSGALGLGDGGPRRSGRGQDYRAGAAVLSAVRPSRPGHSPGPAPDGAGRRSAPRGARAGGNLAASCSAAPVTGLPVPGTANTCASRRDDPSGDAIGDSLHSAPESAAGSGFPRPRSCLPQHTTAVRTAQVTGEAPSAPVPAAPVAGRASTAVKAAGYPETGSSAHERLTRAANLRHATGGNGAPFRRGPANRRRGPAYRRQLPRPKPG